MAQAQNDVARFAGPSMINDSHHMSGIPQSQDQNRQGGRQSEQAQSGGRQQGGDDRQGGQFEYHNPRQYS